MSATGCAPICRLAGSIELTCAGSDGLVGAGSWLAERYAFAYPHELEDIVRRVWHEHKQAVARR